MQVGLKLTPAEFSKLHNCICHLSNSANAIAQLGHEDDAEAISEEVEKIRALLKPAYDEDEREFTKRHAHYRAVGDEFDAQTAWSIYEVEDLHAKHPYTGALTVTHQSHWGDNIPEITIQGDTWADLFIASDKAIKQSGDMHHCYIEGFNHTGDTLVLMTGS